MVVVGIKQGKMTHDFFPHPYPCENHAPSQFSCRERSWSGFILIKDAYLHDDKLNICHMPRYTIDDNFNLKHSITNQWWGLGLEFHTMIIYNL